MPTQNYGEKLRIMRGKKLKYRDANSELWGKTLNIGMPTQNYGEKLNFGMPTQNYGEKLKMRIMGKK